MLDQKSGIDMNISDVSDDTKGIDTHLTRKLGAAEKHFGTVAIALGLIVMMAVAFSAELFGGWKLSFTNINYSFAPFSTSGVSTKGPLLSDIADNVLPIAYVTFQPFKLTPWLSEFGIGISQSVNLYLSPLNYFYMLPLDVAQVAIMITKFAVAFVSMFFFVRQLGYTWRGGFVSGASFAMCSVMVMWNGWPHSEVTMYAPLLFLLLDKLLKRLSIKYVLSIALVVYLMLIAGMPTYAAYFLYMVGAYVVFYGITTYRSNPKRLLAYFGWFFIGVAIGVVLSLPYTGALLNSIGSNGYSESRKDFSSMVLGLPQLKTMFFPYTPTSASLHPNESTIYTGILAVVTLPFTLINFRNKPRSGFFAVSAVVMLLLIFTGVLNPIFTNLPMINTSLKFRVLVLLNFSLAVLVGINIDDILTRDISTRAERMQIWAASAVSFVLFTSAIWIARGRLNENQSSITQAWIAGTVVAIFLVAALSRTIVSGVICKRICTVFVLCGVAVDVGYFDSQYQPLIDKDAPVIPKATDSISYLQHNTKQNQKIVTLGEWNFFPSSNMFYGLKSISGHGFLYTQPDVQEYFEAIESSVFDQSPTRPTFKSIEHENLLKYLGVKYVVGSVSEMSDRSVATAGSSVTGPITSKNSLTQQFQSTKNGLNTVMVLLGTSGATTGTVTVDIQNPDTHKTVASSTLQLKDVRDNNWAHFNFPAIADSAGKTYDMVISANDNKGIAVYSNASDTYEGSASFENHGIEDISMACFYEDERVGADDLIVRAENQYSPQVQLTDNVEVLAKDSDVLTAMQNSYQSNTVFLSKESFSSAADLKQHALSEDEGISNVTQDGNGSMSFDVKTDEQRYVLVNEYSDGNWLAYMDGKALAVNKGNYVARAIEIPAGTHHIVFKYRSADMEKLFGASGAALLLVGVLFITRKKIDRVLFGTFDASTRGQSLTVDNHVDL